MYRPKDEAVPGYALQKFLGRGGFGEVWLANAPGGIPVAVKIINLADDQGFKEFRAINLFRTLKHPNLVPLLSIWLKDDEGNTLDNSGTAGSISLRSRATEMLIIMGLGDKSLRDRHKECTAEGRQGIPPRELLRYMEDAAKALDYLNEPVHQLGREGIVGIQHCDIKPANILIVGRQAQVCDFGVARVLGEHARSTTGAFAPAYVAPEMIDNKPCRQTDQYSLGISYTELRTGVSPVPTHEVAAAILAHKAGKLDLSRLSPGEQEVVRKATSVDPSRRFETCEEFVEELKAAYRAESGAAGLGTNTSQFPALPGSEDPSDLVSRSGRAAGQTTSVPAPAAVAPRSDSGAVAMETRMPSIESTDDPFGTRFGDAGPQEKASSTAPAPKARIPVRSKARFAIAAAVIALLAVAGFVVFQMINKDKDDDGKANLDSAAEVQELMDRNDEGGFRKAAAKLSEIKDATQRKSLRDELERRWHAFALAAPPGTPIEKVRERLAEVVGALDSELARQSIKALERPEWVGVVEGHLAKGDPASMEAAWDELAKQRDGGHKDIAAKYLEGLEGRWFDAVQKTESDEQKRLPLLEKLAQKTGSKQASAEIARIKGPDLLIKDTLATLNKPAAPTEADIDRASKSLEDLTKHAVAGKRAEDILAVLADLKKDAAHLPKRDPDDLLTFVWIDVTAEQLKEKKAFEDTDRQALLTVNRRLQEERIKQIDDLFASKDNTRAVYRASVLRAELYRRKPSPMPADRTEAVASYQKARDVALALFREAPPAEFADEVLGTLIARLDDKDLLGDAPSEKLREAVAGLYVGAGKLIAADLPTWSTVKKLGPTGKKLVELYTQAQRIAPGAENLVLKVFAETEERLRDNKQLSEAEIEQLGKHAEEAIKNAPELEVGYNLRGYALLLRSGAAADFKERQELLGKSLKEFDTSAAKLKKKVGDTKDEQITLAAYRSIVSLSLGVTQIDKPTEQETNLRNAVKYAEEAVQLGQRRHDARQALANARETVGRTFGEADEFGKAEAAFNQVISGNASLTQLKPFIGRGRCRYFAAAKLPGKEKEDKLRDAEADLTYVIDRAKGGFDAVEALQYRARVIRERGGAGDARKESLAKAGKDLSDALAIVSASDQPNSAWKEGLLLDLGYLEYELARLYAKGSTEQKQHLDNAAKHAADLKGISPFYSALLLAQVRDEQGNMAQGLLNVFKRDIPAGRLQDRHRLIEHFTQRARQYLAVDRLSEAEADAAQAVKLDVKGETNPHTAAAAHGLLGFVKFQQGRSETAKAKRSALMTEAAAESLAAIRAEDSRKKKHVDSWLWRYILASTKVDESAGELPASEVLKYLEEAEKATPEQLGQTVKEFPSAGTVAEIRREMARLRAALRQ